MTEPQSAASPIKRRLGCALHAWLAMMAVSGGIAVAILALIALPLAQTGWDKAGVELPDLVVWMIDNRAWIAIVGLGAAAASVATLFMFARSPVLRYSIHILLALVPIVIAVVGIFAWWLVYAAMLRQQMEG